MLGIPTLCWKSWKHYILTYLIRIFIPHRKKVRFTCPSCIDNPWKFMGSPGIPMVATCWSSWETISVWWPLPIRRAILLKLLMPRPGRQGPSGPAELRRVSSFGKANTKKEYLMECALKLIETCYSLMYLVVLNMGQI